ncbi:hypothetical protein MNBD_GAMMA09-97 [hydrothermal vent metagenome]|uniref:DUF4845 domain-containing protein n=1 Tax=hydrothermal vent metagenome TaxID=652676 RepID=A0A3B0Y6M1_9ZZZZ
MMRKQSGLTMISWMLIIGFLAIQFVMALRVGPVYLNDQTLKTVMEDLKTDAAIKGKGVRDIKFILRKRLKMNSLYDLASDTKAFKFKKIKNGYAVTADYEARGPIFGNLGFVATFKHEVEILTK